MPVRLTDISRFHPSKVIDSMLPSPVSMPAFAKAMKAFNERQSRFEGTPTRTKMTFETVAGTDPSTQQ